MKKDWQNNKYFLIAVYIFFGILLTVVSIFFIIGARDYFLNKEYQGIFKILTPFFYGIAFAYLLNPLLIFFQKIYGKVIKTKKEKNRQRNGKVITALSIFSTYLLAIVLVTLLFIMVLPQVGDSINQLAGNIADLFSPYEENAEEVKVPEISEDTGDIDIDSEDFKQIDKQTLRDTKIGKYILDLSVSAQKFIDDLGLDLNIEQTVNDLFISSTADIANWTAKIISPIFNKTASIIYSTASGIINFLLGIIISLYLLIGKKNYIAQIKKLLFSIFPTSFINKVIDIMRKSNRILGAFINSKIQDSVIVGVLCFICMSIFGIKYAMLISVIVGVTNIIPFFGPFIGAIPSIFFLFINDPMQALWFTIFIIILQQIDGNIIGPKLISTNVNISALWIIFAIIVTGGIFGIFGMFLGVPVFAVIYMLIKEFSENRLKKKNLPIATAEYADYPINSAEARTKPAAAADSENTAANQTEEKKLSMRVIYDRIKNLNKNKDKDGKD